MNNGGSCFDWAEEGIVSAKHMNSMVAPVILLEFKGDDDDVCRCEDGLWSRVG